MQRTINNARSICNKLKQPCGGLTFIAKQRQRKTPIMYNMVVGEIQKIRPRPKNTKQQFCGDGSVMMKHGERSQN